MMVAGAVSLAGCGLAAQESLEAAPAAPWSTCEIVHASEGTGTDWWGVYGATSEPRGTKFTYLLTVDGETTEYPLVAKAGSILVNGVRYGPQDADTDDGLNTSFGFTSADMPSVPVGHQVSARVTLRGETICR